MKRSMGIWQLLGFAVTSAGGTLLHFLYEWLDGATWVAPFSGVNESTWEHMKLLLWPMLVFAAVQRFFFSEKAAYWCVKLRGILVGLFLIPLLFYTYNGVIGPSPDWVNIAIFFVSAAIAYGYEARLFQRDYTACKAPWVAIASLLGIALLFVLFTFLPPHLALFQDPVTGTYGIG